MKPVPGYLDLFISPITGKLSTHAGIPISYNYTLIGDRNGNAIEGPAIIDIWLDIRNIKEKLASTKFILQTSSPNFINSQALDELPNGLISNLNGVIVQTHLTKDHLWIGDDNNLPIETTTLPINTLPDLPFHNIWIGNDLNRPIPTQRVDLLNLPPFLSSLLINPLSVPPGAPLNFGLYNIYMGGINPDEDEPIAPTATLKIDKSNLPNLSKGKIWLGTVTTSPPTITFIPTPPFVEIDGDLNWDGRGALPVVGDSYAVPKETGLDPGTIFIGDPTAGNEGQIIQTGLEGKVLFIGDPSGNGRIIKTVILYLENMANLTFKRIWRGNAEGRPEESDSLTILEETVSGIEEAIAAIEEEIIAINAEILTIQGQLLIIDAEILGLQIAIGILQGEVAILQGQIIAINQRIDNLRLNNIPADADVSFYGFKLINLADPTDPMDGVNLRTLEEAISGGLDNITLDGFVEGNSDPTGFIHTTRGPDCTLDRIPAENNVSLDNFKIINLVSDDVEQLDAINAKFLWDLMHDNVGVVYV